MMDLAPVGDRGSGAIRIGRRRFLAAIGAATGLVAAARAGLLPDGPVAAQSVGPDLFDTVAASLDHDPDRIFRFVAEEIRFEPYVGSLRGAAGTYMARAGNAVDQALLLAALLRAALVDVRLVEAPLDDATAATLLDGLATDPATARQQVLDALSGLGIGGRPVPEVPLDDAARRIVAIAEANAGHVRDWAAAQLSDTMAELTGALAGIGATLPSPGPVVLPRLAAERHTWVQARNGPDWLDLDPTAAGGHPGVSVAAPVHIHAQLPDELRHRVTVRVLVETTSAGALREEVLLDVDLFTDELALAPIGVFNVQRDGLKALGATITSSLEGGTTYLPCLLAGELVAIGPGAFRFGDPADDPFGAPLETSGPGGVRDGEPIAEWLEITIVAPDGTVRSTRRPVFDRLGPVARRALVPDLGSVAPVALVEREAGSVPDYLPALRTFWLTLHTGIAGGEPLATHLARPELEVQLTGVIHRYHLCREELGLTVGLPAGVRTYDRGAGIVSLTLDQEPAGDGIAAVRAGLDVWHLEPGALPVEGLDGASPGAVAGILAHVAERIVAGDGTVLDPAGVPAASVGAVFDAARRDGVPLRALRDPAEVDALGLPVEPGAVLAASLATGAIAVLPERPVAVGGRELIGWWLVDPLSGTVRDQLQDGRGSTMPENHTLLMNTIRVVRPMKDLGICVGLGVLFATFILTGAAGAAGGVVAGGAEGAYLSAVSLALAGTSGGAAGALAGGSIPC